MRFLLALLPWLELFTLIQLGIETSALTALAYVMFTFFLGLVLIRQQGENLFGQLRQGGGPVAARLLVDDMSMGFAGLLLMIPGVLTDVAALLVLIGPVRRRVMRVWQGPEALGPEPGRPEAPPYQSGPEIREGETLEGEFQRVDHPEKR